MQISRFNPLGYEATTDKGNKYKATNRVATSLVTTGLALNIAPLFIKNNFVKTLFNELTVGGMIKSFKGFKSLDKKVLALLTVAGIAVDSALNATFGHFFDKGINKKRAEKADKQAESLNTNA